MTAMDFVIRAFLGACGTGFLTLLVLAIKWFWKKIKNDDLTIKALAHDAYFQNANKLLPKEIITKEELENHNYLYRAYHAQGLNSTGDRLHELILDKPVETTKGEQ